LRIIFRAITDAISLIKVYQNFTKEKSAGNISAQVELNKKTIMLKGNI